MTKQGFAVALVIGLIPGVVLGQAGSLTSKPGKIKPQPADTAYSVVERGPHHNVWEKTVYELAADGEAVPKPHRFVELATGLNFQDSNGQWTGSQEIIEACPGGAIARHGQNVVLFANNLATAGAIDLTTQDGKRLQSQILGLSYYDSATGKSVMIAEIKDCQGKIVKNQVVYEDAFSGIKASVRYTYSQSGFEQDVVVEQQLPGCDQYGLDPDTTVLQVLTEFINPPAPSVTKRQLKLDSGAQSDDEDLDFGSLKMARGKAFSVGGGQGSDVPVSKQWLIMEGRNVLVEEVSLPEIKVELKALPSEDGASIAPVKDLVRRLASNQRVLPGHRAASSSTHKMETASLSFPKGSLVLDYATLSVSATNYVFQGDTTYFISGTVNLYGSNVWEGNAIIKYASNACINLVPGALSSVNFNSGLYRPTVFTSIDDDSFGEAISGSAGSPSGYYANPALGLAGCGTQTVSNVRFISARQAVSIPGTTLWLSQAQFIGCQNGIKLDGSTNFLRNALFANTVTNFIIQAASMLDVENATLSGSTCMVSASAAGSILAATNCILADVANLSVGSITISGQNNGFYNSTAFGYSPFSSATSPFQTANGAGYYLATQSVFHVRGTNSINASLLAALKVRTTYAPIVFTNIVFPTATNFSPCASRDTGTPDLGYHYDPLDYSFGGCTATSNMTFTAGTAVGWFRTTSGWNHAGHGITIANQQVVSFNGACTNPCYFVRNNVVQESGSAGFGLGGLTGRADQYTYNQALSPEVRLSFTRCSMLAGDAGNHFRDDYGYLMVRGQDCEFWGGSIGGYVISCCFTNTFFDRTPLANTEAWPGTLMYLRNCALRGGSVTFGTQKSDMPVTLLNCAFDGTKVSTTAYTPSNPSVRNFGYNAYLNGATLTTPVGTNDVITNNFVWQTGMLGGFYQASTNLVNKGNTNANLLGLYHYTTQTNQSKESNSLVDIGYHYVAVDGNGNPLDADGDGVPDYLADSNGNGQVDAGETPWIRPPFITHQTASQTVLVGTNVTFNVDATGGLLHYQWRFNGANITWGTQSTCTLTNVQLANAGSYSVVVTNMVGTVTSSSVILTAVVPASITVQPISQSGTVGNDISLGISAMGSSLSYHWYFNSNLLSGATNATLLLTNVQASAAGNYYATATNLLSSATSSMAVLTVNPAQCVQVPSGLVSWWRAETNVSDFTGTNNGVLVAGAGFGVGKVGQAFNFQSTGDGVLTATAGFPVGTNDRTVECWVNIRSFTPGLGTFFAGYGNYGMSGQVYHLGAFDDHTLFFSQWGGSLVGPQLNTNQWYHVAVASAGNSSVKLYLNGTNVAAGTLPFVTPAGGSFYIGGASGKTAQTGQILGSIDELAVYSRALSATEIQGIYNAGIAGKGIPPVITNQPISVIVNQGSNVTFSAGASGVPLIYQWRKNGFNLTDNSLVSGANASLLNLQNLKLSDSGIYTIVVSNALGQVVSTYAVLRVVAPTNVVAWGNDANGQTDVPSDLTNMIAVAGGQIHSLALKGDGTVVAWGDNSYGLTNIPSGLTNVIGIASGWYHNLVLKSDGMVVGWGPNWHGETNTPPWLTNVVAIAAGGGRSLALKSDGTVVCWGDNSYGGTNVPSGLSNVVSIAAGGYHNLAVKNDGTVVAWGNNNYNETNVPTGLTGVIAVAAGSNNSFALRGDGTVVAWGDNWYGETNVPSGLTNVVAIAAGGYSCLALKSDGIVVAWGFNGHGETNVPIGLTNVLSIAAGGYHNLAIGNFPPVIIRQPPSQVVSLGGNAALTVSAIGTPILNYQWYFNGAALSGATHNTLLLTNVWGNSAGNYFVVVTNNLGSTTSSTATLTVPPMVTTQVANQTASPGSSVTFNVTGIGSGTLSYQWRKDGRNLINNNAFGVNSHSLTLNNLTPQDSGLYTVEIRDLGGIAISTALLSIATPAKVIAWGCNDYGQTNIPVGLTNVMAISGGYGHSLSLKSDGTVACWGYNGDGETNIPSGLTNVVSIASGYGHNLALKTDGTLTAWGYNGDGETNIPLTATNVVAIGAGVSHNLALRNDGTVIAWGYGNYGETNVPVGLRNVVGISAGAVFSLALKDDGRVVAWGYGDDGETNIPSGLSNVVAIASGFYHGLALKSDGSVVSWGANYDGETIIPSGLTNVIGIAAGDSYSMALKQDGTVVAWGYDDNHQTNVPPGLTNVISIAAGEYHALALVPIPPVITLQPANQTVNAGSNVTFSVTVSGTAPLNYQWFYNGAAILNVNQPVLTLSAVQLAQAGNYTVKVANAAGSVVSLNAQLMVDVPVIPELATNNIMELCWGPFVTNPPAPVANLVTIPLGTGVFGVDAANTYAISYVTMLGETALSPKVTNDVPTQRQSLSIMSPLATNIIKKRIWRNAPGSTNLYLLAEIPPDQQYYVDSMLSGLFRGMTNASPSVPFTNTSSGLNVVTFFASTNGVGSKFQWSFNGIPILGATGSTCVVTGDSVKNGMFSVLGRNSSGIETVTTTKLVVNRAISILASPQNQTVCTNETAVFAVSAGGDGVGYQWLKDGNVLTNSMRINGATNAVLSVSDVQSTDGGLYKVRFSNSCGTVDTACATLTVFTSDYRPRIGFTSDVKNGQLMHAYVSNTKASCTYEWSVNGVVSSTAPSLLYGCQTVCVKVKEISPCGVIESYPTVFPTDRYYYGATDPCDNISPPPEFLDIQPRNKLVCVGDSVSFTVTIDPYLMWYLRGAVFNGQPAGQLWTPHGTNVTVDLFPYDLNQVWITITNVSESQSGDWGITFVDQCSVYFYSGTTATLTVVPTDWHITSQPQNADVEEGSSATFQVSGAPSGSSCVWKKDGVTINSQRFSGVNSSVLTVSPVLRSDSGFYTVTITTPCSSVTSIPASLTVCYPTLLGTEDQPLGNLRVLATNIVASRQVQPFVASNAFDGLFSATTNDWRNCWWGGSCTNATGDWLRVDLSKAVSVGMYEIYPSSPLGSYLETGVGEVSWNFEGSPDGTNWTVLQNAIVPAPWTNGVKNRFTLENANLYSHYRINNYAVWSDGINSTNIVGISELRLFERINYMGTSCGNALVVTQAVNQATPLIQGNFNPLSTLDSALSSTIQTTVTDQDSTGNQLSLVAYSSNPDVLPNQNILITRTSSNQGVPGTNQYTLQIMPIRGTTGTSVITLLASDSGWPVLSSSTNLLVVVNPTPVNTNNPVSGNVRLGYWRFNDAPNWKNEDGLVPSGTNGLVSLPSWSGDGVWLSSMMHSLLEYTNTRTVYSTNVPTITYDSGTIRFWFRPDWDEGSGKAGGAGSPVRLFEAGRESEIAWSLSAGDFHNLPSFAGKMRIPPDRVSEFILTNLSSTTLEHLSGYLNTHSNTGQLITDLAQDINSILTAGLIYDANRFTNVVLRAETQVQLALTNSLQGDALFHLNRMLFEDAFPSEIATMPLTNNVDGWLAILANSVGTQISVVSGIGGSNTKLIGAMPGFTAHQWYQVVLTYTNVPMWHFNLYVNGQPVGSADTAWNPSLFQSLKQQGVFRVGCAWGGIRQAEAMFDELETFNYPLNTNEIVADYQTRTALDSDGDGIPDITESGIGTNPLSVDTDCDGLPDGWERNHGQNPLDGTDVTLDMLQRYTQELLRPSNTNSSTPVLDVRPGLRAAHLTWDSVANAVGYRVYCSTNPLNGFEFRGFAVDRFYTDQPLLAGTNYYYSIVAVVSTNDTSTTVQSAVTQVVPWGCATVYPPPHLYFVKTLTVPTANGSYVVSLQTLLTNSVLQNLSCVSLVYKVDKVVSGSLMINGSPFGPDNNTISSNSPAMWTAPSGPTTANTPAFRVYLSSGSVRLDETVDVHITQQPERYVYAWGANAKGQLGNGRFEWGYTHNASGGTVPDNNGVWFVTAFPWCDTSINYVEWEGDNGIIPQDSRFKGYSNYVDKISSAPAPEGANGDGFEHTRATYQVWENTPVRVLDLPSDVRSIFPGHLETGDHYRMSSIGYETLAVGSDGQIRQWGIDLYGMFGKVFSYVDPTNGYFGIKSSSKALAWGGAMPTNWVDYGGPLPVISPLPMIYKAPVKGGGREIFQGVSSVYGTRDCRLALKEDGTLWSWGLVEMSRSYKRFGRLGRDLCQDTNCFFDPAESSWFKGQYTPVIIAPCPGRVTIQGNDSNGVDPGRKFVEVQIGAQAGLARCKDGSVWWWGEMVDTDKKLNAIDFVDRDETKPWQPICLFTDPSVRQMSVDDQHYVFLRDDGSVAELGVVPRLLLDTNGPLSNSIVNIPAVVVFPTNASPIAAVSSGNNFGAALDETGDVWIWGYVGGKNIWPAQKIIATKHIIKVVTSSVNDIATVLALDRRGFVWGWGDCTKNGLLGYTPKLSNKLEGLEIVYSQFNSIPRRIPGLENVSDIFAGGESAFAIGTTEEGKPTGLTAIGLNQSVKLSWNSYLSAGKYRVYRSMTPDEGYSMVAETIGATYWDQDPSLRNGQDYYYRVSAVVNGCETRSSTEADATPRPEPSVVNIEVTNKCRTVLVSWGAPTNFIQSCPLEYRVERASGTNSTFEPISHFAPPWDVVTNAFAYEDCTVVTNQTYFYRVVAVNYAGEMASVAKPVSTGTGTCHPSPAICKSDCGPASIPTDNTGPGGEMTLDTLLADDGLAPVVEAPPQPAAKIVWTYSANDCAHVSAFRLRIRYANRGRTLGVPYTWNIATNDALLSFTNCSCNTSANTNAFSYLMPIKAEEQCWISVSAIYDGEESASSDEAGPVVVQNSNPNWSVTPRAIPGYQQVYLDWPDRDWIWDYSVESSASSPGTSSHDYSADVDWTPLASGLSATRYWDTGLKASSFSPVDILSVEGLVDRLTGSSNSGDLPGQVVWNHLSPSVQYDLNNFYQNGYYWDPGTNAAMRQELSAEFNKIIVCGANLLANAGLTNEDLSTRSQQLLTNKNSDFAELNRSLLEDAFVQEIARFHEPAIAEVVSGDIKTDYLYYFVWAQYYYTNVWELLSDEVKNKLTNYTYDAAQTPGIRRALAADLTRIIQTNSVLSIQKASDLSGRALSLYNNQTRTTNDTALLNRLMLQNVLGDCIERLSGLKYYRVEANACDGSGPWQSGWVAAQPLDLATNPASLSFSATNFAYSSMVLVQWMAPGTTNYVASSAGQWQFYVERKSGTNASDPYSLLSGTGFGLAYMDSDVANGQTYSYRVSAVDTNFNRYQSTTTATPTYTNALTLLKPVAGNTYIDLSWTPVRAATFYVEHSLNPQGPFDTVGTLGNSGDAYQNAQSTFRHVPIVNQVTHYYRIEAQTPTGISIFSNTNSAVPLASLPPLPPKSFAATLAADHSTIILTWFAQSGASRYQVFARQNGTLQSLFDGRSTSCVYSVPTDAAVGTTLIFDIRCVGSDNTPGEMAEINFVIPADTRNGDTTHVPAVSLKVGGQFVTTNTSFIGPTNLTLAVDTGLANIKGIRFYDSDTLIGTVQAAPFQMTWYHVTGGLHSLYAKVDVTAQPNIPGSTLIDTISSSVARIDVIIKPELAAYSTSATDLQLPAPGLPITLSRSYSSRDTNSGVGYLATGWKASWLAACVQISTNLGEAWMGSTAQVLGATLYDISEREAHNVTVILPDGEQIGFMPSLNYVATTQPSLYTDGTEYANGDEEVGMGFVAFDVGAGSLSAGRLSGGITPYQDNNSWNKAPFSLIIDDPGVFTYTGSDGAIYQFGQKIGLTWLLTQVTDRNGNSLLYTYDSNNQIIGITNSNGRGISFSYTSVGTGITNISVSDSIGGPAVLKYLISNNQLASVSRLKDRGTSSYETNTYLYGTTANDTNRLTQMFDSRGIRLVYNQYMVADDPQTSGNLLSQTDVANRITTYNLTNNNLTVTQTTSDGTCTVEVTHDASGAISGVTQPTSGTIPGSLAITNSYDDRGQLIAQQNAEGKTKTYAYDAQGHLIGQSDEIGNSTSSILNTFGQPTQSTDAMGISTKSFYDDQGNPTRVEDPSGTVTTYTYADATGSGPFLAKRLKSETRSAPGVPYALVTEYSYVGENDTLFPVGDLKSVTQSWGSIQNDSSIQTVGTPVITSYEYDANGNRISEIKPRTTSTGLESITNNYTYDAQNRVVVTLVKSSLAGNLQTNSVTYNTLGKQFTSLDVYNHLTANIYDVLGNLIQTTYPDTTVSRTAYNADGRPAYVQDRAVVTNNDATIAPATHTTYDVSGRTIKVERLASVTLTKSTSTDFTGKLGFEPQVKMTASGMSNVLTTTRTFYDDLGRVEFTIDARTNVTQNVYDDAGRRTNVMVYLPSTTLLSAISDTASTSDIAKALGNAIPTQTTSYVYDANGNQTSVTDTGHTTINVYDAANRLTETRFPDTGCGLRSHITRYNGLGQRISETDEAGVTTGYTYDFRGLLTSVTLAANTPQQVTTVYAYDEVGNLLTQTDAQGHKTTFAYDALGRRISRTLPDGKSSESFVYDNGGNLLFHTNFNGVVIANLYDLDNRLTNRSSVGGYRVSYAYSQLGLRTNMTDASGTTAYSFDNLNRLTNKAVAWSNGPTASLKYGYDVTGSLTNIASTTPNGVNLAYAYDSLGRLTNVLANGSAAAGYGFDPVGNLQSMRYGNGVTNCYQYDARNRLINLGWNSNSISLATFAYQVGPTGIRTNLNETLSSASRSCAWTYDSLYRLNQEALSGGLSKNYAYDLVGNRTNFVSGATNQNFTYTPNDWLSSDQYDKNGNTVSNTVSGTCLYDAEDHLTNFNNNAVLIQYDADGNRVKKVAGSVTTYYLVDDRNPSGYAQILEEYQPSIGTNVYNYGLSLVSQRQLPTGLTLYYGCDGQGSVRFLMGTNGVIKETYTYDAFGIIISAEPTTINNYRYTGQQWDPDLGMYYLRARYYKPDTGRFWTMDTYEGNNEVPLSLHKYSYAHDSPVNLSDPSGKAVYFVERRLSCTGGVAIWTEFHAGHGYLLFTPESDSGIGNPFDRGQTANTFSWHPNSWDYASGSGDRFGATAPGRVWENHSDDTRPSGLNDAILLTTSGRDQKALHSHIQGWISANRVGYELGDPIDDPKNPGKNDIGRNTPSPRVVPGDGSIYYSLGEQNCVWWATIMLKQCGIGVKDGAFDKMASYNGAIGGAADVIHGSRSAFTQNRSYAPMPAFFPNYTIDIGSFISTIGN